MKPAPLQRLLGASGYGLFTRLMERTHGRDKFLLTAGSTGIIQRLAGTGLGFLTTGLLTRLLGREDFGIWATLSVLPQWIALADLGINQSLTTRLGHLFGANDDATSRRLIWSGFWTQFLIACAASALVAAAIIFLPVARIFGSFPSLTPSELQQIMLWLALGTLLTMPFRGHNGILLARQRPVDSAVLGIFGSVVLLLMTFMASRFSVDVRGYSILFTLTTLGCCLVGTVWLFGFRSPQLWGPFDIDWNEGKSLTKVGFIYFLGGVTWILNSTLDSLMLANMVGPGAVTDYNLTLKLFSLTSLLGSVAGSGLLPAYAEALGRGDIAWIKSRYRFTMRSACVAGLISSVAVGLATPWVAHLWSGGQAKPSWWMIAGFTFWFTIFPINTMIAFVLAGLNRAKEMLHVGLLTTVINIPVSYCLIHFFGASGAAAGIGIAIFLAGVVYAHRKVLASFRDIEAARDAAAAETP